MSDETITDLATSYLRWRAVHLQKQRSKDQQALFPDGFSSRLRSQGNLFFYVFLYRATFFFLIREKCFMIKEGKNLPQWRGYTPSIVANFYLPLS
jgi:hypothetical protein